jgi:phospholipid/cholesterol/gamma-HCH transport system ATP-binding protein
MSIRRHQRDDAGLRPGDVIDEVNRQPVSSVWDYQRALRALGKRAVVLGLNRQGVTAFLVVEPDYFWTHGSGGILMAEALPIRRDVPFVSQSDKPCLKLNHVTKRFGSNTVLNDVTFEVAPGQTICILGRSGVGKSVCLRLIMGFLKPDAGRIVAAGEDITDYLEDGLNRIHKRVTMVFQNGALFDSLTIRENVAFPLRERDDLEEKQIRETVDELLGMVGAREIANLLPAGISTGMKRSIAIARALAANPSVVLYDEPTSMVDPIMARRLVNLIAEFKVRLKLTAVLVTHDMRLVEKLADRVIFLDGAKVTFAGTPHEMQYSSEQVVSEFVQLDRVDFSTFLGMIEPRQNRSR